MESHVFLTHQAVRSLDGLTAFSALPDAPVLPVKAPRRHRILMPAWPHGRSAAPARWGRFTPATTGRPVRVTPATTPPRGAVSGHTRAWAE